MKKLFLIFLLFIAVYHCTGQIVINEVCYSNKNILFDRDNDTPDWFELYNPGSGPVNLADFKVTDDTSKSDYWRFPEYELGPGNYVVIFASDKDIRNHEEIHTDFKLGNMRESLYLISKTDEIIDEINPQCVPTNCTLARFPDGSAFLVVMKPSPGRTNDHSEKITVNFLKDSLTVSSPGGLYDAPLTVSLTNSQPGNVIMYTLNGKVPDEESSIYNEPLFMEDITPHENRFADEPDEGNEPGNRIFKANILRAVVYSDGCPASNEISNTYFVNKDIKNRYKVPVVSLITDKDNLFDKETGIYVSGHHDNYNQHGGKWERDVHVEIFNRDGNQIIDQDAGLRIHGRRSRELPQKSFRLYAESEYGAAYFEYPFFSQKPDLEHFKTLILRATNGTHGSLLKSELCNTIVQKMNIDYLACETVITFINGEYWGIYNLSERNDKHYIENNYGIRDADPDIISYEWEITVEEGDINEYNRLMGFIRSADPLDHGFYDEAGKIIDIEGLIDYYTAQLYFANADWPKKNLELWKLRDASSKWRPFFFDPDAAMIWVNYNQIAEHNILPESYRIYPEFSTEIFSTLIRNEDFRKKFMATFLYHLTTTFNTDTIVNIINRFEEKYLPLVPEHIYRWRYPVNFITWKKTIDRLRNFAVIRPMIIAEQLQTGYGNPFTIYPNPGKGTFNLSFSADIEPEKLTIYSVSGAKLFESTIFTGPDNTFLFETGLSPGLYIVRITADGISWSGKLIIQ